MSPALPRSEGKPVAPALVEGAQPAKRPRGRPRGAQTRLLHEGSGELGRHHFAFLRALLDGIDLERAWQLYMAFSGGPSDRRHYVSRLRQIVDVIERGGALRGCASQAETALQALRALPDFPAAPRRPRRSVATPPEPAAAVAEQELPPGVPPTLEEWRATRCAATGVDEDFYSEAEWLELYAEEFGAAGARAQPAPPQPRPVPAPTPLSATTLARLAEAAQSSAVSALSPSRRRSLLDALGTLEAALARDAALADETGSWLGSGMPRDLAKVGVKSLSDLVSYINIHGYRWHRHVPRLGEVRAERLLKWLAPIADVQGQPIKEHARRPQTDLALLRQRELARQGAPGQRFSLVPIVDGQLPDELSGRKGLYRSDQTNIWGVETDIQAITQWLSRYRGQTQRDYTRVTERFYLWCVHVRRKAVSSLQEADLQAYHAFIAAPPADWVQERKVRREDPTWRPFRGPLGRNSQRHEFTVLGSLFGAMLEKGYLRANAMANLGRALGLLQPSVDVRRSFDARQWSFLMQVLRALPPTPERTRVELLLELGSTTGLRLSELATARMKGFRQEVVDGEPAWLLDVIGKGGKQRTVVVFDHVKALLEQHHRDMDEAGVGFDAAVLRVQRPSSLPRTAAGQRAAQGAVAGVGTSTEDSLREALEAEHRDAWRPLVGMLRKPPPRRSLDRLGVPFVDKTQPTQADRFGALERSAIYKVLRRFFRQVAVEASSAKDGPDATSFLAASTHWLRHTFANAAVKQMQPQVVQALMGHSDLRVTSVYVKADATDVVRGMRALKRGSGAWPEPHKS